MSSSVSADGANDRLIAIVAHELRYPLVPIRNAAALLRGEAHDPATVRRAVEIIERQTSGMQRLIDDLVDVSRMQTGTLALRRVRTPLVTLMDRAQESTGPYASEHGHVMSVSVSSEPIYLEMDVLRLGQALHNIIANAIQYTDNRGLIHVRAQREGTRAIITVSDTGIGIADTERESIFGLFAQGEQGTRLDRGLGLGLYLARYLIAEHGGTVIAESDGAGHGSVFRISLPCGSEREGDRTPA